MKMVDERKLKDFFGNERSKSIAKTRNEERLVSLKKDRNQYRHGGGSKKKDLCDLLDEMHF